MEKKTGKPDTAGMKNELDLARYALLDRALELAEHAFPDVTEEHVEGVLDRLVWNELRGQGEHGATTIH